MLDSGVGGDFQVTGTAIRREICGHAPSAIAGDLRLAAIRVDKTDSRIKVSGRHQPLHTICSYPVVAIANPACESMNICRCILRLYDQEVIAACGSFGEWDLHTLISVVAGNSLEVAQVFGLAQAALDLVLFFARTIHSEDDFFPPIRANQLHAFHLLAMLLQDGVNL